MNMICFFDPSCLGIVMDSNKPRVREVISHMRYSALVRRGIIPDLEQIQQSWSAYRYPACIKKRYSDFGLYCEHLLKKKLSERYSVEWNDEPDHSKLFNKSPELDTFVTKCLRVVNSWIPEYGTDLRFNIELEAKNLVGHPDIITESVVWDVKCGHTDVKSRQQAYLQILAYWAMSNVDYIGLILPLANKYVVFDMRGWNRKTFLHELNQVAKCIRISKSLSFSDLLYEYPIGRAVSNKNMIEPITEWIQHCVEKYSYTSTVCDGHFVVNDFIRPMQMYLENPRGNGQSIKTVKNLPAAKELITNYGLPFFTHAPLAINLANKSLEYMKTKLRKGLEQTVYVGGKGFVVHVGKSNSCTVEEAYANQASVIKSIIPSAIPSCRVLLETPCGKSSDICVRMEDMNNFLLNNFTDSELQLIGLCVDTCHVFVAGYDPLKYLQDWMEHGCVGIGLVHFNDSENFYGKCVEGHKYPGRGAIGYKKMRKVAEFCVTHGIPMIFE